MFWKTQPPFIINIPNPCHENWQQMDVLERGRFCQACQTVVTDFSALSDDEIIKHIEQAAGGKMCGRFSEFQINRRLISETKVHRISAFRKVAASVLMLYASLNEAMAQNPTGQHTSQTTVNNKKPVAKDLGESVKGKVIDFTGQGVQGLELQIKGTDMIKTTDAHGNFKFMIPDSCSLNELVINPTQKGKLFLDSIGAMIRKSEIDMDTIPVKASIIITLYPIEALREIDIIQQKPKRDVRTVQNTTTVLTTTTISGDFVVPHRKKTAAERFKSFFKRKRNG